MSLAANCYYDGSTSAKTRGVSLASEGRGVSVLEIYRAYEEVMKDGENKNNGVFGSAKQEDLPLSKCLERKSASWDLETGELPSVFFFRCILQKRHRYFFFFFFVWRGTMRSARNWALIFAEFSTFRPTPSVCNSCSIFKLRFTT